MVAGVCIYFVFVFVFGKIESSTYLLTCSVSFGRIEALYPGQGYSHNVHKALTQAYAYNGGTPLLSLLDQIWAEISNANLSVSCQARPSSSVARCGPPAPAAGRWRTRGARLPH